jgi:hypothetical protein
MKVLLRFQVFNERAPSTFREMRKEVLENGPPIYTIVTGEVGGSSVEYKYCSLNYLETSDKFKDTI